MWRYPPKKPGNINGVLVSNGAEVLDLCKEYNLKLVLQGHLHWIEDVFINNKTHFITGGSVAGRPSWRGTENGPRGLMYFSIKNQDLSWKYIEYEQGGN